MFRSYSCQSIPLTVPRGIVRVSFLACLCHVSILAALSISHRTRCTDSCDSVHKISALPVWAALSSSSSSSSPPSSWWPSGVHQADSCHAARAFIRAVTSHHPLKDDGPGQTILDGVCSQICKSLQKAIIRSSWYQSFPRSSWSLVPECTVLLGIRSLNKASAV